MSATNASGRSSRSTTTPPFTSRASEIGREAEEPLALSRAAADHRRAAHRLQLRLHAARAVRRGWPIGSASRELYIKDDSVNHPTLSYKDRVVSVAATRAVELGFNVLACASTGNLANSVAAHAARLGIECCVFIPDNLEAGEDPRLGDLPADDSRDRRQLRRCEPAVHAGGGSVRVGIRQHQPALVLRRRREDAGLRNRRAAWLAVSEARRVAGRRRYAAAAHPARFPRAARGRPRRRRAAADVRGAGGGLRAGRARARSGPRASRTGAPGHDREVDCDRQPGRWLSGAREHPTDRRRRRGGHRTCRSSTRFSCSPKRKASSPSRPAARRSPRRSI